jgi:hypothetical protein
VILSAIAAGIGGAPFGAKGVITGILSALVGWFVWALLTYLIGAKLLREPQTEVDLGQLLRTIGFAASPGILRVFGGIPVVGMIVGVVASVWMLVAFIVGVRQALDYKSTGRAVLVCVIGFLAYLAVAVAIGAVLGVSLMALTRTAQQP